MKSYRDIFGALNEAKIHYIIVGGVALNLLGYPRFTGDIDLLLALDQENLRSMAALMKKLGYQQRIPVSIDELGDEKRVLQLIKDKHLIAFSFAHDAFPQFSIDIIVGESLKFKDFEKHVTRLPAWDITVPVIGIDDLIGMKKRSPRKKDADDVAILLELKGL